MAAWQNCFENFDNAENVATIKCLEPMFANILSAFSAIIGVVLFIMLVIGGYSLLFSGGDPKKLQQARGTITMAVIGLVVIASAYLVIRILQSFLGLQGTELTTFEVTY